jgi:hypothetical protein
MTGVSGVKIRPDEDGAGYLTSTEPSLSNNEAETSFSRDTVLKKSLK